MGSVCVCVCGGGGGGGAIFTLDRVVAFEFKTASQTKNLTPVSHCKHHGKQTNK